MGAGPWYIAVVGSPHKGGPRVPHATLEIAQAEAARMHAWLGGAYNVRVLETIGEIERTCEPPPVAEKQPEPPKPAPVQPKQAAPQAAKSAPSSPEKKAAPVIVVKKKRSAEAPAGEP